MGEAERRAAAPPHTVTAASEMLRKLDGLAAALPPAPMNGATSLDLSPSDYEHVLARAETKAGCFDGASFLGLGIQRNAKLPDGVFIGRRRGKAVWSNHSVLQAAIDCGHLDNTP